MKKRRKKRKRFRKRKALRFKLGPLPMFFSSPRLASPSGRRRLTQIGVVNFPCQASRNQSWKGVGLNGTRVFKSGSVKSYLPSEVAIREIMRNWPCMSCDCCAERRDDSRVSKLCSTRVKGRPII